MNNRKSSVVMSILFVLSTTCFFSLALAQTSEMLPGATSGTAAGSLEVLSAFVQEHDASFYAEDAEFHVMTMPEPFRGREAIAAALGMFYGGAFSDTHVEHRTLLADGGRVVLEFVYHGTNSGEFMGMPPTGRRVTLPMLGIYEIEGDFIQRGRLYFDGAAMMHQLATAGASGTESRTVALTGPAVRLFAYIDALDVLREYGATANRVQTTERRTVALAGHEARLFAYTDALDVLREYGNTANRVQPKERQTAAMSGFEGRRFTERE
jgi:predicted ester cyclase